MNFSAQLLDMMFDGNHHYVGIMKPDPAGSWGHPTGRAPAQGEGEFAEMAAAGRAGDTMMAHLTPGELTIPPAVQTPEVLGAFARAITEAGGDPSQYIAGSPDQSINPETGQPEFGWFDSVKNFFKPVASVIAPIAGYAIGGPIGAGVASGATNYLYNKDAGQALTAGGIAYLGAAAGEYMNDKFGGMDISTAGTAAIGGEATGEALVSMSNVTGSGFANAFAGMPLAGVVGAGLGGYAGDKAAQTIKDGMAPITGRAAGQADLPGGNGGASVALPAIEAAGPPPSTGAAFINPIPRGSPAGVSYLLPVRNRNTGDLVFNSIPTPPPVNFRPGGWGNIMAV